MGLATVSVFKTLTKENNTLKALTDDELKHLQHVLLLIVKRFNEVCQDKEINYMLGGGSCLGAIRHSGFIPWDDDMDLNMARRDYEIFEKIFDKEMGDSYWLQSPERTKNYGLAFARLRKKGTIFKSREDYDRSSEDGIYIDIFIIENTYDFVLMRYLHGFLSLLTGFLLSCRNFYHKRKFYMEIAGNNKKIRRIFRIKIIIGFFVAWRTVDAWTKTWNNVNKMCGNNKSKYVVVPTGRKHFFGEIYKREKFCKYEYHPFETLELPVTVDNDEYLKHLYGDYMKIPKKSQQEDHIFLELDFGKN